MKRLGDALEERGLATAGRRSTGGCRRPTRRGPRAGPRPRRGRAGRRATSGRARPPTRRSPAGGASAVADEREEASTGSAGDSAGRTDRRVGDGRACPAGRAPSDTGVPLRAGRPSRSSASSPSAPARAPGAGGVSGRHRGRGPSVATSRRSWPARSSPTRMSPSRRSARAGSPRALSDSTATSTTVRLTAATENGRRSMRSGGLKRPRAGHDLGVAGAAGERVERDVRPGPGTGGGRAAGREELDDAPEGLVVAVAEPGRGQPEARPRRRRAPPRRAPPSPAVDEGPTRPSRAIEARPRRATGQSAAACQPHGARIAGPDSGGERQPDGRLRTERPGRRPVGHRQAFLVRTDRRLAQDEADPRGAPAGADPSRAPPPRRSPASRRAGDPTTAVAAPSSRLEVVAEPGLDRAARPALEPLDEAADGPDPVLEREPRVALAPRSGRRGPGRGRPGCGAHRRVRVPLRRLAGSRAWRNESRRAASTGAARRSLSIRSRIASRPTSWRGVWRSSRPSTRPGAALDDREPVAEPGARRGRFAGIAPGALDVARVERRLALLAAAERSPAHDAAVELAGRTGLAAGRIDEYRRGQRLGRLLGVVGQLFRRRTRRATRGRPQVAQRVANSSPTRLQAGLAARRGAHRLERGVEVAEVRRAEDELGEEPGQRARFEARPRALAVDRGAGDPAAAAGEIEDDVARLRECASIRAATSAGGGGGASRSKNGRVNPGSARTRRARPAIAERS